MNAYPLISCICVANGKPAFFDKAFECFEKQNYPNRELVVAYHKKDYHTHALIEEAIHKDDFKLISVQYCSKDSWNDIMKHAVLKSTGYYFCNWNEEDWHHQSRLSYQYNSMQIVGERFQGSVLSQIWMHDYQNNQSYLSASAVWTETLLCKKDAVLENWAKREEEISPAKLIQSLSSKKMLFPIDKMPSLYIKAYHNEAIATNLDEELNQKIMELLD